MSAWQSEMDKQAENFDKIFEICTETMLDQEYSHFGGPIRPRMADMFRKFASGDLELADAAITRLADTNMQLGRDYTKLLGDAQDYLDDWEGAAATDARSWMRGMDSALARQRELVDALIMVHKAKRAVIEKFRADILQLIDATNKGMKAAGEQQEEVGWAIVSAVAGVVAACTAPLGVGLVVAIGASMIAGGASIAAASVGGENQAQVMVAMVVNGEDLIKLTKEEMAKVEKGFTEVTKYLTGSELKYVRPDRPDVVTDGDFRPDDFHPEDGYTPQVRDKLPKTDVLPEPPKKPDRDSDHGPWGPDEEDRYPEQIRSAT